MWSLGIDLGTTHLKVVGVADDGSVLPARRVRTPLATRAGRSFHDPEQIWSSLVRLIADYGAEVAPQHGDIAAICIASLGQEESFPVDDSGRALAGSLAWWESWDDDALGADAVDYLDSLEHYAVSGFRLRSDQSPYRLAHLRAHEPSVWEEMVRWVDFATWVGWKLTGVWRASSTQITHSQLVDLASLAPHGPSLTALGLDDTLLVPSGYPGEIIGAIRAGALDGVSLSPDAVLVLGGHDQVIAASAITRQTPTTAVDSIGTSEFVMVLGVLPAGDSAMWERNVDVEPAWRRGDYLAGWAIPTGKVFEALNVTLCGGDFDALEREIAHLEGTRTRLPSIRAIAETGGIDLAGSTDDPGAVIRAVADHIAAAVLETLDVIAASSGTAVERVVLTGSLFRRPGIIAHRSSRTHLPLLVDDLEEPVAAGAAMIARDATVCSGVGS